MEYFEPKIVGFCCDRSAYASADISGASQIQYPSNLAVIRIRCSGSIDPLFIMEAFQRGADAILIAGCRPGNCSYQTGNYVTVRRVALLKGVLSQLGIDPNRLRLEWLSAVEGFEFAQLVSDFVREIRQLGPV